MTEPQPYIFEVSKSSFADSVLQNSRKIPVVVEFMGVWSEPCIRMSDDLAALAQEFAGQFVFARIDVDEQPELRRDFSIEHVPTLKVFKDGEAVRTEEGLLQKDELQALLKDYGIYRRSDELRQQARLSHMAGETLEAIRLLTQAIQQDPANTRVAMDMVQVLLDIGELEQARALFNKLPDRDKESETGRSLIGQLTFRDLAAKTEGKERLLERIAANPEDHDARFDLAVCLVAEHDYVQAMENLFEIHGRDPQYREGAAQEMIISLCNMLATKEPQLAQEFRRRLGSSLA
jgi:putative thioredoxin